ncbi:hypothetical protein B0T26DRAFT_678862 [Lasiosphaeria miniovina]|uniref:Uncharacterized protein n=1 Tax=Lasiosphaeria miniovina TaxID=1954250 RepID=A0AA40A522_9PEZI|nr:uncharacterized protein B0T26DRAFT_678862 [Lasiosphaeria miniovina]KAK0709439.1 hypothetical protein B0T26DRAFT_678862 [Lasiosphaeria miniovina]
MADPPTGQPPNPPPDSPPSDKTSRKRKELSWSDLDEDEDESWATPEQLIDSLPPLHGYASSSAQSVPPIPERSLKRRPGSGVPPDFSEEDENLSEPSSATQSRFTEHFESQHPGPPAEGVDRRDHAEQNEYAAETAHVEHVEYHEYITEAAHGEHAEHHEYITEAAHVEHAEHHEHMTGVAHVEHAEHHEYMTGAVHVEHAEYEIDWEDDNDYIARSPPRPLGSGLLAEDGDYIDLDRGCRYEVCLYSPDDMRRQDTYKKNFGLGDSGSEDEDESDTSSTASKGSLFYDGSYEPIILLEFRGNSFTYYSFVMVTTRCPARALRKTYCVHQMLLHVSWVMQSTDFGVSPERLFRIAESVMDTAWKVMTLDEREHTSHPLTDELKVFALHLSRAVIGSGYIMKEPYRMLVNQITPQLAARLGLRHWSKDGCWPNGENPGASLSSVWRDNNYPVILGTEEPNGDSRVDLDEANQGVIEPEQDGNAAVGPEADDTVTDTGKDDKAVAGSEGNSSTVTGPGGDKNAVTESAEGIIQPEGQPEPQKPDTETEDNAKIERPDWMPKGVPEDKNYPWVPQWGVDNNAENQKAHAESSNQAGPSNQVPAPTPDTTPDPAPALPPKPVAENIAEASGAAPKAQAKDQLAPKTQPDIQLAPIVQLESQPAPVVQPGDQSTPGDPPGDQSAPGDPPGDPPATSPQGNGNQQGPPARRKWYKRVCSCCFPADDEVIPQAVPQAALDAQTDNQPAPEAQSENQAAPGAQPGDQTTSEVQSGDQSAPAGQLGGQPAPENENQHDRPALRLFQRMPQRISQRISQGKVLFGTMPQRMPQRMSHKMFQ